MGVPESDWGWGINEAHRVWEPCTSTGSTKSYFCLVGVRGKRKRTLSFLKYVPQGTSISPSAKGQEPNQLLSNQMHHKEPCSQRTKYRKTMGWARGGLSRPCTVFTTLNCEPRRAESCLSHLSPHPQGIGRGLVWYRGSCQSSFSR